ncbi:PspC domain-containing protein, partial [Agromyces albus]
MTRPRSCVATGVAAGLAEHLGWPVGVVRAAFVVLS